MRDPQGRFIAVKRTVLPPCNRGRNSRLALHRKSTYTKKPKDYYLSGQPRSL